MHSSVVTGLESLASWRLALDHQLHDVARFLAEHNIDDEALANPIGALRERLASERIVVAFVAEFSRGKSELINAIFFADTGRRIMPATPGRTTMCPVELRHETGIAPCLALLPIETRLQGLALAELRNRQDTWQTVPLDADNPETLAHALQAVTRTQRVPVQKARALGLWSDEHPEDNPPQGGDGLVEVPAWRHAVIHYPHPLLRRGLVVIDTPGLNAIGAEPELTLGLLPSAHATVFLLAADTGVTKSDLSVWREHLSSGSVERFVVLNKIDTLADPLASSAQVQLQINSQRELTAATLDMPVSRVFPLSARDALAARVSGDAAGLAQSRLPELEDALTSELMPRQREILSNATSEVLRATQRVVTRRVGERRRQNAEQLLDLRGLRGKSGTKLRLMQLRLGLEATEFEACTTRLSAMRAVQMRMMGVAVASMSSDNLRREVMAMNAALDAGALTFGARAAFTTLCSRLRATLVQVDVQTEEMRQMLDASCQRLNADFAFALVVPKPMSMQRFVRELDRIEAGYGRYLSITRAWRMAASGFREQFRRMLLSRLRVVFENAAAEVELWSKSISGPMDQQLRDRRVAYMRRREAMDRISGASGELELRIDEVQTQDQQQEAHLRLFDRLLSQAQTLAEMGPKWALGAAAGGTGSVPLSATNDTALHDALTLEVSDMQDRCAA